MIIAKVEDNPVVFRKVKDEFGWMSNMSAHPVRWEGEHYRTTEALFQCLRFSPDQVHIRNLIRSQTLPMDAKNVAKSFAGEMRIQERGGADMENMRTCLELKIATYPALRDALLTTGERTIIEDVTRRPEGSGLFWGAALEGDTWRGSNCLGVLWMDIREALEKEES